MLPIAMKWFIFSLPAIRTSFYSAGPWVCWRLGCYGTSSMENALLGRFPLPEHQATLVDAIRLNSSASVAAWPSPVARSNQS